MMRAGRLRHTIVIQRRVAGQDSYGQPLESSWENFKTVRASVEPLQGREFFSAQAVQSEANVRFRMRHVSGVTSDMRISFSGDIYEIHGQPINPNNRSRELHIMAKRIE